MFLDFTEISITEKYIIETAIITKAQKKYALKDLVSIKREKVRFKMQGFLTDGYYYSILTFNDKRKLCISPDDFGNYDELMLTIRNSFNK